MEIIVIAIVLVCVGFVFVVKKLPKHKGKQGEKLVKKTLGKPKENQRYIFNNCMFKQENKTIQIDHILVCKKGVIVIETKNYSGTIYGADNQSEWTQCLGYGKIKNTFYNPVKQNASHCYYIRSILDKNIPVVSVVVFVDNNTKFIESSYTINLCDLKRFLYTLPDVLSCEQIVECSYKINNNLHTEISNRQHIKNIKKMQKDIQHNICPRCGGSLVLNRSEYGDFWGCCNYPKCKFKKRN